LFDLNYLIIDRFRTDYNINAEYIEILGSRLTMFEKARGASEEIGNIAKEACEVIS
jgi:hypothetical protein